jgi:hypothetical protein
MAEKKVKLKMGMHNPVTKERFQVIKGALAGGMTREAVKKKYNIKDTTLSYIRRAETYYEYRLLTERLPRPKKMPTVYGEKSGLPFEDYGYGPIFFSVKKVKPTDSSRSNRLDHEAIKSAEVLGWLLVGALFLVMAILIKLAGL